LKPLISIISPVYKAEESILILVDEIKKTLLSVTENFEIILVEDGSPDNSWDKIIQGCLKDERVKGIKLSRNFGQHFAITAGLEASRGEKVIVMDCDLQDDPKYIIDLINKSEEGFDIVYTSKKSRKHSSVKNLIAKFFYWVFNFLIENSKHKADDSIGSYSLLSRKVVDALLKIQDYHRHYLLMLRWLGYPNTSIEIEHQKRRFGKSSYNLRKLVVHAIVGITSQSNKLLYLSIGIGFTFFIISLISIAILISMYLIHGYKEGWTSVIVLVLFSTGLILMSLGILGIYIGKIFDQSKNRPLYLVDKKVNFTE
jgi:glycosyltransferase involved in cell wall biosynthesis